MTISITDKHVRNRIIILIIGLLFLGFCLLTILPWAPTGFRYDLDQSWASAFHVAFAKQIQFGQNFIYTYGPYGFLRTDLYFAETYGYAFVFRLLIAIAVWAGLFKIMRYCLARRQGAALLLIPILGFFPNPAVTMDSFQFPLLVLPLVLYFYVSKSISPVLVLTIMTASLASLTKHTYLLLCIVFISLITVDELGRLKRFPQVASIYLVCLWLFWTLAAQDVANFPAYMINGLEIVRGFSEVMGFEGNLKEIILYLFSTSIFLLIVATVEWKNRRWWGMLPTLGLAAFFLINFKGAFTRHDAHALQALFSNVPVIFIFTAVLWSDISKSSWRIGNKIKLPITLFWGTSVSVVLIMGAIMLNNYLNYGYAAYSLNILKHLANQVPQVIRVLNGKGNFLAIAEQSKAQVRAENVLPPVTGTVDLYANEIANIFAYDLTYQPRPVIQSFSAYTSKLARLNAEHLKQPDAAETILFDLQPIDGHLASFEDGLSWPEILTRYDITNIEGRYLILQRNSQPRQYQFEPITEQVTLGFNEWFDVPKTQELIWGKIELHPNLLGKLATAALRLPVLYLEVETADGIQTKYRTIGDVMNEGFLLSPILANRWDFLDLASSDWQSRLAGKEVVKFRIIADGLNSSLYPPEYQFSLSKLQLPRQDFAKVSGWQDWSQQIRPLPVEGSPQRTLIDGQQFVWLSHAPMKTSIALEGTEQRLSFKFGISDEGIASALKENEGDGVEFKIIALTDGSEDVLFSRKLQPRSNSQDRGVQEAEIDLSQIRAENLILETLAGKDNQWDWSYWSELKAE